MLVDICFELAIRLHPAMVNRSTNLWASKCLLDHGFGAFAGEVEFPVAVMIGYIWIAVAMCIFNLFLPTPLSQNFIQTLSMLLRACLCMAKDETSWYPTPFSWSAVMSSSGLRSATYHLCSFVGRSMVQHSESPGILRMFANEHRRASKSETFVSVTRGLVNMSMPHIISCLFV